MVQGPGYSFKDEFDPSLKNMIKLEFYQWLMPDQKQMVLNFSLHTKKRPELDNKHSVFGHVVEGQSVVDAIAQNDLIDKIVILKGVKKLKL